MQNLVCRLLPLVILFSFGISQANELNYPGLGGIGGGLFIPSGSDADIARTSPIVQLSASIVLAQHLGIEAEFHYIPILFDDTTLTSVAHRKATQLALMGGLRFTTASLSARRPVVYLSGRAGFARIATRANNAAFSGGWIGRTVDAIENPNTGLNFSTVVRQKGLLLSPKAGLLLPITSRTVFDIGFAPIFIFDSGDITTQYHITLSLGIKNRFTP